MKIEKGKIYKEETILKENANIIYKNKPNSFNLGQDKYKIVEIIQNSFIATKQDNGKHINEFGNVIIVEKSDK